MGLLKQPMTPDTLIVRFGERLRQLREHRGMSQEALAVAAQLHRTHISLIERGKRIVRLDTIERLANALDVKCHDLLTPKHDTPRNDLVALWDVFPAVRDYQTIATRHGIDDIFQDNGGKLLQILLILNLKKLPGRLAGARI
jgi:transcriptional regulator with XRE-family HTH domain